MQVNGVGTDTLIRIAIACVTEDPGGFDHALDVLPVPIYLADAQGLVTYYNPACIDFAGRVPQRYRDRWCITERLYTAAGAFLPRRDCPMAVALKERRAVRGVEAVAERPDGSRVPFQPYPTPLFGDDGALSGAINLLVDVSARKRRALELHRDAAHTRRLAALTADPQRAAEMHEIAADYERQARAFEAIG